ncbi:aldo/keto reductase [Microbacterium sp. A84]|uniref:aldo/keto reductase n=1 Tax=Microbacterium sp. A84 TaxID=3450715 RepID=UPI003F4302E1
MPRTSFGVFRVPNDTTTQAVSSALDVGYRGIDTASIYGNEEGTGRGIDRFGLGRDDVFVTSKVWNTDQGYDATLRAYDASLKRLRLSHLDLYLIHWPAPSQNLYVETWRALTHLLEEGRVREIGVSNFTIEQLEMLRSSSDTVPAVNQVELHPRLQQPELLAYHAEHGIITQAWSPLANGSSLQLETVRTIAARHGRSPAQVILRWHLQMGRAIIPKSVTPSRMRENLSTDGFELNEDDMAAIEELDSEERTGPDPREFVS